MKGIGWIALTIALVGFGPLGAQDPAIHPTSKPSISKKTKLPVSPKAEKPAKIPGLEAPLTEPLRVRKNLRAKINPNGGGGVEVLGALKGPMRKVAPDPIAALLMRIGGMEAWVRIGELQVTYLLKGYNGRGKELFSKRIEHRAQLDPSNPQDEIVWFQDASNGGLKYGRNGARVWVRTSGVDRPDLEKQMGPEVDRWGEFLRFPFNFADRTKYSLGREERVLLLGKPFQKIRLFPQGKMAKSQVVPVGPLPKVLRDSKNWIDLYLDPETKLPLLMEMKVAGHRRRITLGQWRKIPGSSIQIPFERTFLDEDGETQSLRVQIQIRNR
jgi:hypothetical protein